MTNTSLQPMVIEGEFTIFSAQALKEQLLAGFDQRQEIALDLSRVTEMDSSGLQLLIAAKREAAARQQSLHFCAPSQAVLDILNLCGLSEELGETAPATDH
jgi:anti-anti-sigma factor